MSIVEVTLLDEAGAVSREGFGMPLVFDPTTEQEYVEVTGTDGLSGYTSGDMAYDQVSRIFEQEPSPEKVAVFGSDMDAAEPNYASIDEALNSLLQAGDDDFYFVLIASRVDSDIEDTAGWAGANGKLFVGQPDIADTVSNITTMANNISSDRAVLYAHDGGTAGTDPYIDAAITGRIAPIDPGSTTWKFKNLNGVPLATYSDTDISDLHDANVNTYVKELGVEQTSDGLTTGGSYADIQRGKDWLQARIKENIGRLLINTEKVAFEDGGIAQVIKELKSVLKNAVEQKLIAKDADGNPLYSVDAPTRAEVASNDIANRILPDVDFEATIAGAIHKVEVEGVLKV